MRPTIGLVDEGEAVMAIRMAIGPLARSPRVLEPPIEFTVVCDDADMPEGVASLRHSMRSVVVSRSYSLLDRLLCPAVDVGSVAVVLGLAAPIHASSLIFGLAVIAVLASGPLERIRLKPTVGDDLPALLRAVAIPLLVMTPWLTMNSHDLAILRAAPVLLVVLASGRFVTHSTVIVLRRHNKLVEPSIIIGAGELGQKLATALRDDASFGICPIGFIEDNPFDRLPLPVLGGTSELASVLLSTGTQRVIVAYGFARDSEMVSVLRACDDANVAVYVLPRFFELGVLPHVPEIDDVHGMQLVRLRRAALRTSSRVIKRTFDVLVAGAGILILSPLMAIIGVAVRLSSPGPILFKQQRVGQRGQIFDVLKFRSMTIDARSDTQWGRAAESRITRVGALIRKTSLDELPQLLNVMRGDMSIVGPRPERPHFAEMFGESIRGYSDRQRMAAGVTGWSQIHGLRGDTSISDRAAFDNYYVENWSLWLDIRIVVRTVRAVVLHMVIGDQC